MDEQQNNTSISSRRRDMVIKFQHYPVAPWIRQSARWGGGLNPLLNEFLRGNLAENGNAPRIDVGETKKEIVVLAELPGTAKEDLKIVVEEGILTISGERKEKAKAEGSRWLRNEIASGRFSRSIELSVPVDAGQITATLVNGLLRIVLPKAEQARPREITIK
jgi:HSP20 family protein